MCPGPSLPVLVELFRFNNDDESVPELLSAAFGRSGVKNPDRFLQNALTDGILSIFFDGLDEVVTAERDYVVTRIERFAEEYPRCQIVVTCRDAVYDGELRPLFNHEVRIAGFDDAAIRRFWRLWLTREGKEVDVHDRMANSLVRYV